MVVTENEGEVLCYCTHQREGSSTYLFIIKMEMKLSLLPLLNILQLAAVLAQL